MNFPSIPGFTILNKLGTGGFGSVYHARWENEALPVAIKTLDQLDDDAIARFKREAKLLEHHIDHPHVVKLFGYDTSYSPPFIVMEYCPGGSLDGWVSQRHTFQEVSAALIHAATALAAIHEAGGFHRDVKPGNLLLSETPEGAPIIKLSDFGLARLPSVGSASLTRHACGTPSYMAPELHRGADATAACDIYSLGLTGLSLLTGRLDLESVEHLRVPNRLRVLIQRMTADRPSQRPDAKSVILELKAVLQEANVKPVKRQSAPSAPVQLGVAAGVAAVVAAPLAGLLLGGLAAVFVVAFLQSDD